MNKEKKYSGILLSIGIVLFIVFLITRSFTGKHNKSSEYKNIELAEDISNLENEEFKNLMKAVIEKKDVELSYNNILILRDGDQNEDKYKEIKRLLKDKDYETNIFIVDIDELYKLYDDQTELVKDYLAEIKFKDGDILLYNYKGSPMKINGNIMLSNKIKAVGNMETKELVYVKTNIIKNKVNISDIIGELNK